ncbi:MAG: amidohydrolase family protein, partial [Ilumatobacteraceae bacterium]
SNGHIAWANSGAFRRAGVGSDTPNPPTARFTRNAAWQCRADDITGSLEVGKYADLVFLEDDPTRVDPTTISNITVSETRIAGKVRYSRA